MSEMFQHSPSIPPMALPRRESSSVEAAALEWQECGADGFLLKALMEDPAAGLNPHISPISYCGRRKAHCGAPYSRRPAKRSENYAGADLWSVRRATASLRRPRYGNR